MKKKFLFLTLFAFLVFSLNISSFKDFVQIRYDVALYVSIVIISTLLMESVIFYKKRKELTQDFPEVFREYLEQFFVNLIPNAFHTFVSILILKSLFDIFPTQPLLIRVYFIASIFVMSYVEHGIKKYFKK